MRTFTLRAVADAFVQYVLVTFAVNGQVTPDVLVHTNGVLAAMLIVSSGAPEEFVFSVNAPSLRMKIDFSDAVVNLGRCGPRCREIRIDFAIGRNRLRLAHGAGTGCDRKRKRVRNSHRSPLKSNSLEHPQNRMNRAACRHFQRFFSPRHKRYSPIASRSILQRRRKSDFVNRVQSVFPVLVAIHIGAGQPIEIQRRSLHHSVIVLYLLRSDFTSGGISPMFIAPARL